MMSTQSGRCTGRDPGVLLGQRHNLLCVIWRFFRRFLTVIGIFCALRIAVFDDFSGFDGEFSNFWRFLAVFGAVSATFGGFCNDFLRLLAGLFFATSGGF